MNSRFNRRFNLFSVKQKVEQLRHRNKTFNKFLHTPNVMYDIENCESLVNDFYWRAVDRKMETPLFWEFRVNDEPFHLKLSYIFDESGVATFPKDLTGSREWPIHIRDSEDDEKAVVPFAETSGCVPPLLIAFLGKDVVTVEKTDFSIVETPEKDVTSGSSSWDVD
ncbi:hypothetical protein ACJIZ3_011374 [Penstemon smallii]|uniref:Uncharacterized protein n=1 Tax=Penstemon smallii TaxID=265156 RepID=A0ABD3UKA5_9LAMI